MKTKVKRINKKELKVGNIKFARFLTEAKKNTYALQGERGEKILDDGTKELTYRKTPYVYRDRYFGSKKFIGEEIVFRSGKPVWGMNYCGSILLKLVNHKEIYSFLKKVMYMVKEERPFRGPKKFTENNFLYKDTSIGNVRSFMGTEEIYLDGKKVYKLNYHGGDL